MSRADATDLYDYEQRELAERVAPLIDAVRRRGDQAVARGGQGMPRAHQRVARDSCARTLRLSDADIGRCLRALPDGVIEDLRLAQDRMRRFADAQRAAICDFEAEALPGIRCGVRHVPVQSAGVCLPAEPAGPSLQDAQAAVIVAHAAGVNRVVACVPAANDRPPALLVGALALAGVADIYLAGGVRALAALTFGTESIPRVELVLGTPDRAMDEARRQLAAISPSRLRPGLLIVADDEADPDVAAADLISARERGPDARGALITTSPALAARVSGALERHLDVLAHRDQAVRQWRRRGTIRLASDPDAACRLADRHGFECVELMTSDPRWYLGRLHRCRQVFLGEGAAFADGLAAPAMPPLGTEVGIFLRAIAYREGHARDESALTRLWRLAGLESHARACEARAGRAVLAPALAGS